MSTGEVVLDRPVSGQDAREERRTVGAWFFRQRSWVPVLPALAVLVAAPGGLGLEVVAAGIAIVAIGQALRFWAVRHIGVISRTRTTRIGPLVTSGPYAFVRNPLYLGNWLLWTGFVVASRVLWMLPVAWAVFALQYGAIARWEEDVMSRAYPAYVRYAAAVNRWIPAPSEMSDASDRRAYTWSHVLFSERGTLIAIAVMAIVLAIRDYLR